LVLANDKSHPSQLSLHLWPTFGNRLRRFVNAHWSWKRKLQWNVSSKLVIGKWNIPVPSALRKWEACATAHTFSSWANWTKKGKLRSREGACLSVRRVGGERWRSVRNLATRRLPWSHKIYCRAESDVDRISIAWSAARSISSNCALMASAGPQSKESIHDRRGGTCLKERSCHKYLRHNSELGIFNQI